MKPREGEFPPPPAPRKAFARGATFVTLPPPHAKIEGAKARTVAQEVCDRIDNYRFIHNNRRFRVGASIGLVPLDCRWFTSVALMQAADTACYAAKEAGRNRVHEWLDSAQLMQARQGEINWVARRPVCIWRFCCAWPIAMERSSRRAPSYPPRSAFIWRRDSIGGWCAKYSIGWAERRLTHSTW